MNKVQSEKWNKARAIVIVFACGALLTGCADLQAVRQFSKTSAATADYNDIVADYLKSPERQKLYQPENKHAELDDLTKRREQQKKLFDSAQGTLVIYMSTLGDLAADDLPNVDNEIDGFNKALETAKFVGDGDAAIKTETATAAGAIAKVVIRAVLDHWRQAETAQIIKDTDSNVQSVIVGLCAVLKNDLTLSLAVESENVTKYFEKPIAAARSHKDLDAVPPLATLLEKEHESLIQIRRDKITTYEQVLKKIAQGHADLAKNVDTLDESTLKERLKLYSKDLQTLYKSLKALNI